MDEKETKLEENEEPEFLKTLRVTGKLYEAPPEQGVEAEEEWVEPEWLTLLRPKQEPQPVPAWLLVVEEEDECERCGLNKSAPNYAYHVCSPKKEVQP